MTQFPVVNSSLVLLTYCCLINHPRTFSGLRQGLAGTINLSSTIVSARLIHEASFSWVVMDHLTLVSGPRCGTGYRLGYCCFILLIGLSGECELILYMFAGIQGSKNGSHARPLKALGC